MKKMFIIYRSKLRKSLSFNSLATAVVMMIASFLPPVSITVLQTNKPPNKLQELVTFTPKHRIRRDFSVACGKAFVAKSKSVSKLSLMSILLLPKFNSSLSRQCPGNLTLQASNLTKKWLSGSV